MHYMKEVRKHNTHVNIAVLNHQVFQLYHHHRVTDILLVPTKVNMSLLYDSGPVSLGWVISVLKTLKLVNHYFPIKSTAVSCNTDEKYCEITHYLS